MPKFLVDESSGKKVAELLKQLGYDAYSVAEEMSGAPDQEILNKALHEGRVIVTNDKELTSLALSYKPTGIVLLRLADERTEVKLRTVRMILDRYVNKIEGNMIVATEKRVRVRSMQPTS